VTESLLRDEPARPATTATDSGRTVLYIEDEQDNILLVKLLLDFRPHITLRVATTGHEGVKVALDEVPDLILLDNRLPDATGSEILRELSKSEVTAAITVIVVSADSGRAISDELLKLGATEMLTKPYDIKDFLAMVDCHLSRTPDDSER
jgi:DNA-binding response OmpR family regulator